MNYKLLEPEITKSGFRFRQLVREGDIAIFHKVHLPSISHPKAKDAGFEVVVIQKHNEHERAPGVIIEAKEALLLHYFHELAVTPRLDAPKQT
jgi:hypothetical protein